MPKPNNELFERLGPEVQPFERFNKNNKSAPTKKVLIGEKDSFDNRIYNATEDGLPPNVKFVNRNNLEKKFLYLWIINKKGLFLIFEQIFNPTSFRKVMCHTNITKGKKALQGGELWFIDAKEIVINYNSGRYGADTTTQQKAVLEYFKLVGYSVAEAQ